MPRSELGFPKKKVLGLRRGRQEAAATQIQRGDRFAQAREAIMEKAQMRRIGFAAALWSLCAVALSGLAGGAISNLAGGALSGLAGGALAEEPLAPPASAKLLLEAGADGVQIYVCDAKDQGFAWVFEAPEATLFDADGRQIGTHSEGPTWTFADGTEITGKIIAKQASPLPRAIPWLRGDVVAHEGSGPLAAATAIRRIETKGGVEPASGCDEAHKGDEARIRYSAIYQFYGP
jgi:hypothetical protein